jgi:hypothetical protein
MTDNKLLSRLSAYLDLGARRRRKKVDELEDLIASIKKQERTMIGDARKAKKGKQRTTLKKRYQILHAQRKKGQDALKALRDK